MLAVPAYPGAQPPPPQQQQIVPGQGRGGPPSYSTRLTDHLLVSEAAAAAGTRLALQLFLVKGLKLLYLPPRQCRVVYYCPGLSHNELYRSSGQITPPTKNGHAPPPTKSRKSSQSVNPTCVWAAPLPRTAICICQGVSCSGDGGRPSSSHRKIWSFWRGETSGDTQVITQVCALLGFMVVRLLDCLHYPFFHFYRHPAQDQYIDIALRAVNNKKQVPEIDFTLHTMEDGTQGYGLRVVKRRDGSSDFYTYWSGLAFPSGEPHVLH